MSRESELGQRVLEEVESRLDLEDAIVWACAEIRRLKALERGEPNHTDRAPRRRPRDPQLAAQVLQQMLEALKEGE